MLNDQAIALANKLNKEFGDGSIISAKDSAVKTRFTSGSLDLDIALGGGFPANQWIEIYGKESQGKTAIVLKAIAANQKRDPDFSVFWIAAEHFDEEQALALGVNVDNIALLPTTQMERAFQAMLEYAESRSVDCIVLDSYPALIAEEEDKKEMDEVVVALGARLVGKFFRKAGDVTRRNGDEKPMLGIIINQPRDAIGKWAPHGQIAQTTPGGNAKNFAFYVRLEVKRDDWITETRPRRGPVKVGQTIKCVTVKNKSFAPQETALIDFYFREAPLNGFKRGDYDILKETVLAGEKFKLIEKRGRWYKYEGMQWGSKAEMIEAFREMPELVDGIDKQVHEILASGRRDVIEALGDSKEE